MRDYQKLHFLVLLWGFTAISGKWMSLSALVLVLYRTALAAAGTGYLIQKRGIKLAELQRGVIPKLLATGAIVAAHWFLFFWSARVSNVSISLVGLAGTAFWTSILAPIINRSGWKISELVLGVLVVAAMSLLAHFESQHIVGLLLGIGSGLAAALFTILNGRFTQHNPPLMITFWEMIGAFAATLAAVGLFVSWDIEPLIWWADSWGGIALDAANLFFLAIVCTVYAYAASVELLRRIPAFVVNLSVNLEPVYGIILAAFLFGEWELLSWQFYLCASMIIGTLLAYPILSLFESNKAN